MLSQRIFKEFYLISRDVLLAMSVVLLLSYCLDASFILQPFFCSWSIPCYSILCLVFSGLGLFSLFYQPAFTKFIGAIVFLFGFERLVEIIFSFQLENPTKMRMLAAMGYVLIGVAFVFWTKSRMNLILKKTFGCLSATIFFLGILYTCKNIFLLEDGVTPHLITALGFVCIGISLFSAQCCVGKSGNIDLIYNDIYFFVLSVIALIFFLILCYYDTRLRKTRSLLITGCARSGTSYITRVLEICGLKIGHEMILRDGVVSWEMAVDTKQVPWGQGRNGYRFHHIFHQVRHPLKVISSLHSTEPPQSWKFIAEHIPQIQENDSLLVKCAKYWYYWNLKAEKQAELTYQIEKINFLWPEFEQRCERKLDRESLLQVPQDCNTRGEISYVFSWEDLKEQLDPGLFNDIQFLATKYGYSIGD